MSNIIEQWIELRGNEALQKLLHQEALTFEDKVVLTMAVNREEVKAHREETRKEFALVRESSGKEFASVRSEIQSHREETKKEFASVDARFDKVNARFDKVDARFDKVDARFEKLESRIFDMQNAQNALVWKILGGTGTILALSKAVEHFLK